ncbi:hypothetical protein [Halorussus amylolyticus]|uniref:hypothetical protein n=1 Tax=Halorussus amylolyticus TaxID=1126242 RepID=UPI00104ADA23|nr:hypothetical protein [Halorussus amylolyticus]
MTPTDRLTATAVLRAAGARVRRAPHLVAPFALAGLVVALADWLRRYDPIPAATPDWVGRTLSIQYSIFPQGTARTVRPVGGLLDLRTPYLVGSVALELVVVLAVGLAGWATITRALGTERRVGSLARYLGVLSAIAIAPRLLGTPSVDVESVLLGVPLVVAFSLVLVHLFALPGLLATGRGFPTALAASARRSRGRRWPLFWLVVVFGVASWGLARVPMAGGFLSTALVGPIHAVSLAVLVERTEPPSRSDE